MMCIIYVQYANPRTVSGTLDPVRQSVRCICRPGYMVYGVPSDAPLSVSITAGSGTISAVGCGSPCYLVPIRYRGSAVQYPTYHLYTLNMVYCIWHVDRCVQYPVCHLSVG